MPKKSASSAPPPITLSVVTPTYNAAPWLPRSVPKVAEAIRVAGIRQAEIIIVDDGSTDDTADVAGSLELDYPVKVISQKNSGRFIARHTGLEAAKYDYILFIDTRVFINKEALKYVMDRLKAQPDRLVWTSHVYIDKNSNPYARFWEALTFVAWRKYFANPRDHSYGLKGFDRYPKGTTCFLVRKDIMQEAHNWFKLSTKNTKNSNDDTLLIRYIAQKHNINISPGFSCTYHARTNLKQYCKHVYFRGRFFVDGFLRRDGNRYFWPLLGFLFLSIAIPVLLVIFPRYILPAFEILALAWLAELIVALILKVETKDALSLFVLSPLFAVVYGAGIWTAVFDIYARRNRAVS